MTEQERDELLISLKDEIHAFRNESHDGLEVIENRLEKMEDRQEAMEARQEAMEERQEIMEVRLEAMEDSLELMKASLGSMESQFVDIKKELRSLSARVTSMEKVHGEKLQAIFDIIKDPLEKAYAVREDVDSHENRLDEHDIRIRVLESKVI